MKKIFKIFVLVALVSLMIISLASCGNGAANPDSISGDWEGVTWSYDKESHVLTLTGGGEIPDAKSSADVPWNAVRGAVTGVRIRTGDGKVFTKIGDYAFYGMSRLAEVEIPDGVESIGKCSFAFCTMLDDVSLPDTLVDVGESAFEGCAKLPSITVPASVTKLGARAFAFCRGLTAVTVEGKLEKVNEWCFKDCSKLDSLRMDTVGVEFDAAAFEGAAIGKDSVKSLHTSVVNIVCKDESGATIKTVAAAEVLEVGEVKEISAPEVKDYEIVGENKKSATGTGEVVEVEFTYKKTETEDDKIPDTTEQATEAPASEKKNPVTTVIAIVIFAVVIIAIAVGAFFLIRSDKRTTKDSRTVRKNNDGKGKKK